MGGGGFKILNINIFGGFQNTEYFFFFFWGGGVITKLGYILRDFVLHSYLEVISMHFRVFPEGQGTEWRIYFGLLKFQIFIWGA